MFTDENIYPLEKISVGVTNGIRDKPKTVDITHPPPPSCVSIHGRTQTGERGKGALPVTFTKVKWNGDPVRTGRD